MWWRSYEAVETTATCKGCNKPFTYPKTTRARVRCRPCQREFHLERMRICNAAYRHQEKIKLGISV
ncbi:hypothetical protein [Bradyrhizobium lablabi]|nr:hypothetical protein [Bradyrhizobium lablabi]SEE79308.1 hypothetical protein SAMN05444171_8082 [Bradyrhizobium lablabi]